MGLNYVTEQGTTVDMSYTQIFYHIVFSTKHRDPVLLPQGQPELLKYVKNQQDHDKTESFVDEFRRLLDEAGIIYDPEYLD